MVYQTREIMKEDWDGGIVVILENGIMYCSKEEEKKMELMLLIKSRRTIGSSDS